MMDTKELLKRISALRQRLDQTRQPVVIAVPPSYEDASNDLVQAGGAQGGNRRCAMRCF